MNYCKCSLIYILLCTIVLTGCWGHKEINEVTIVQSTAIDKGKKHKVKLTVEFLKIMGSSQGSSGLTGKKMHLSEEGNTLFEAARKINEKSPRSVIWGHSSVIIFGKEVAEKGLKEHLDILYRQRNFRESALVFIAVGRAEDVFKSNIVQENLTSASLNGLIKSQNQTSTTRKTTLQMVYSDLVNDYKELTIPAILIDEESGKGPIKTAGLYVFKKGRLVSFINANLTKQYLRLQNESKSAVETLKEGKRKYIAFENLNCHTDIQSVFLNGKPSVSIKIFADFNVADVQQDFEEITPEIITNWEKKLNGKIKKQVGEFLEYTKKENVDLIGIGEAMHRENPEKWKRVKKDWKHLYPQLSFSIEVESRIDHTYLLNSSL
ncbi:Ger(X)C family germination protein [Bacillus cereus VD133]|uniref:Ger(X)C family germination protein n=1 Tax=Bacillus cereus VD133 TaxID=1053233 RepID=A0A9W5PJG8_BACCE|nr:Ger(x)C family spore germination protein [Bacillus cereus]EOO24098.1 Ger(X)C family germination protein [Bacillus cereus VD133]